MKVHRIAFLQDLGLSRDEALRLLREIGIARPLIWPGDSVTEEMRSEVDVLVTSEHSVDAAVLDAWPNLTMLSLAFTGYDKVRRDLCKSRGIQVYYVPDYSSDSVAELTVGLALAVLRKIPRGDRNVREGKWDGYGVKPGYELHGRKVGILGTGTIGTRTAALFQAFGCSVTGWSRTQKESFLGLGLRYAQSLAEVFAEADIIALHLPVNEQTRRIVGETQLRLMKPGSILINTARAGLVDSEALLRVLKEGTIRGAGIDVFESEPPSASNEMWSLDNVVFTPHLGFKTAEALDRLARITIGNIRFFIDGNAQNRLAPPVKTPATSEIP